MQKIDLLLYTRNKQKCSSKKSTRHRKYQRFYYDMIYYSVVSRDSPLHYPCHRMVAIHNSWSPTWWFQMRTHQSGPWTDPSKELLEITNEGGAAFDLILYDRWKGIWIHFPTNSEFFFTLLYTKIAYYVSRNQRILINFQTNSWNKIT